ncbi:hypothetical protein TL16_g09298 [Triparma laevis f. inornata]|uniref:Uncharacterized protein n=1 Tax=Triparma laevis f. inornata TaxID=1714386 RepID=A0A9W7BA11_9STRA|nr:hypothetical protein TL16_g09298 [Triparma laevis f. inornata]
MGLNGCAKLAPSRIDVNFDNDAVVAHLRFQQLLSDNNFLNTDDFRRLLIQFLLDDALMTMRLVSKPWLAVAEDVIDDGVASGAMLFHDEKDISQVDAQAREERRYGAFYNCSELKSAMIPDSLQTLGDLAFLRCSKLVPSNINVKDNNAVIAHLRPQQQ